MNNQNIIICAKAEQYLPQRKTSWAVCRDLYVAESKTIKPWTIEMFPSGIKVAYPEWRHWKIYSRSWLPTKRGLKLANAVAVIDQDYRGDPIIQMHNFWTQDVQIEDWERLAQLEILPYFIEWVWMWWTNPTPTVELIVDADLYERFEEEYSTERGAWRFHSTWN